MTEIALAVGGLFMAGVLSAPPIMLLIVHGEMKRHAHSPQPVGQPSVVAEAGGVTLWRVKDDGFRTIYFTSKGDVVQD